MDTRLIYGLVSLVSAGVGAGVSYYVTKQHLEAYYNEQVDLEVGAALEMARHKWEAESEVSVEKDLAEEIANYEKKQFYNAATTAPADPRDFIPQPARDALTKYHGGHLTGSELHSAEEAAGSGAVEEEIVRSHSNPYRIKPEECYEGEEDYTPVSYIWYSGDEVLTDESDDRVELDTVGLDNLNHFGTLGADPNLVYVRNDLLKLLIEVELKEGKYAEIVAGLEVEE